MMKRAVELRARLHSVRPRSGQQTRRYVSTTAQNEAEQPVPPPQNRSAEDDGRSNQLTGAAKLLAEAEAEERELELSGGPKYKPRHDAAVDDSPPWTGDESVRDAVIRLLMDKHKPLRTGAIRSADSRLQEMAKKTDMSPRVVLPGADAGMPSRPVASAILQEREIPAEEFKPWHARYVRTTSATTPQVHFGKFMSEAGGGSPSTVSLLDRPALSSDPAARRAEKAKRRAQEHVTRVTGAREGALDYKLGGGQGYQMKGASAAGGGVRDGPSGMRAWANLVEDRIERARSAGWFDDVKGRGKPIYTDPDQHNPHIDRSEFFMNRIVKRQGAKPPWIELLGELETAQAAFRSSLLSSYTRSLVRSLVTSPFHDQASLAALTPEQVSALRDPGWAKREEGYHKEAIKQLNDLVRKMNAQAPQVVRRGLVTLEDELALVYQQAGPIVVAELAKRRSEGWDKVKGVGGSTDEDDVWGKGEHPVGQGLWKDAWGIAEVLRRFTRGITRIFG